MSTFDTEDADPSWLDAAEARLAGVPLETWAMMAAGRDWRITAARDHEALLLASETLGRFPFGLLLWESALVLADALAAHRDRLAGAHVLELGAGVGLSGLAARALGAKVVQSDYAAEPLALCRRNARTNAIDGIAWRLADWTSWRDTTRYDLIVGSDILYEAESHEALLAILSANLKPGGTLLVSDPGRQFTPWFVNRLRTGGWQVTETRRTVPALQPLHDAETVTVTLIEASHRSKQDAKIAG